MIKCSDGRTDGQTDRQTDGLTDISYANDDGDENDDDDHDAAAAPPPPPMLLLLLMMMMMLIMFNITTAFEHRCRSGPLNIKTDVEMWRQCLTLTIPSKEFVGLPSSRI
ncbi:hypothetical protein DPMN_132150 [Dreissena polymorpha]|uniref:Uncharacterized protein n=1 Tax=Dreissena polymorpha TaxID=45954 RepID=A0A9D4FW81_DREPO|nr:hypothetical protein DPMN_132150 [Dreissena polymorpha]